MAKNLRDNDSKLPGRISGLICKQRTITLCWHGMDSKVL